MMKSVSRKIIFLNPACDFNKCNGQSSLHPRDLIWPTSLLYASAKLNALGFTSEVIDCQSTYIKVDKLTEKILKKNPELLIINSTTSDIYYILKLAKEISEQSKLIKIIVMGQHVSFSEKELIFNNSNIHGSIKGEIISAVYNDDVISKLFGKKHIDFNDTNLFNQKQHVLDKNFDPDILPFADPKDLIIDNYKMFSIHTPTFSSPKWGFLQTSWGCPYKCNFCSQTLRFSFGNKWIAQSPLRVLNDMQKINKDFGICNFYFVDDIATYDKERTAAICEELIRKNTKYQWVIQTRSDCLDKSLIPLMKKAGCIGIKFGVESGNKEIQNSLNKNLNLDEAIKIGRAIKKSKISLTAYYMIGNPGETLSQMEETYKVAKTIGSDMIQIAIYTPYPTSNGFNMLDNKKREKLLSSPQRFSHYNTQIPINLSAVSNKELLTFHKNFYLRYYLSFPQFFRYLSKRAIYTIPQGFELNLIKKTFQYLHNRVPD